MTPEVTPVYHMISSLRRGGRERQLATIWKYSERSGLPIRIICFNKSADSYAAEFNMESGVRYLESKNPVKRYFEIRGILKEEKARLIWTWGGFEATFGLLLSIFTGIKHINGSIRHGIVRFNRKQLWRMLVLHLSKYNVANSRAGLEANRLRSGFVIYNGIDERFFESPAVSRKEIRAKLNIPDDQLVFISVANLVPYKDYATVINALGRLRKSFPAFHYLIVGEGPERQNTESMIRQNDLESQVTILGRRTDIRELLCASDLFIHSSRGEGCSNAILEAMATGLPVVASDTGGTREIVHDDYGRLFTFRDADGLLTILESLSGIKEDLLKMGQEARIYASENFSVSRMMKDYDDIIKQVE